MLSQIVIEAAQREREREVREAIRRQRLLAGDGSDPELALAAVAARSRRRERSVHPVRLATP